MVAPLLYAGGAALAAVLGYEGYKHFWTGGGGPSAAELADLAARYTTKGPKGEQVFKSEIADSLVRALASQKYLFQDPSSRNFVNISPEPSGKPVPLDQSALGWAKTMNDAFTILAPLYLPMPTSARRFLRAVSPGDELSFAGPGGMYAVLIYAGTLKSGLQPPGLATPGGSVGPSSPSNVVTPASVSQVAAELPDALVAKAQELLLNGTDPAAMIAVADKLDSLGFHETAAKLRARAAELQTQLIVQAVSTTATTQHPAGLPPPNALSTGTAIVSTQTDPLALRPAPSTSAFPVLAWIPKGATVTVLNSAMQNGFYNISYGGQTGWSYGGYLQMAGGSFMPVSFPSAPSGGGELTATVATQTDPLALRAGPSSGTTALTWIPKGSTVTILNPVPQNNFYNVSYQGQTGWSSATYLHLNPVVDMSSLESTLQNLLGTQAAGIGTLGHHFGDGGIANRVATVISPSGLPLRDTPNPQGRLLMRMPAGAKIHVIGKNGHWARVVYGANHGWAAAKYLRH